MSKISKLHTDLGSEVHPESTQGFNLYHLGKCGETGLPGSEISLVQNYTI